MLSGRQFYRSKDPTNSIKVLKEKLASHSKEEAQNPPDASHRVTSEPLKKRKTLSQWVEPSESKPHTAGWCCSSLQHYSNYPDPDLYLSSLLQNYTIYAHAVN